MLLPILSIPIEESSASKIKEIMITQNLTEEEMHEHPSDKIMESLGF
jgi:hypothetical protein